MWGGLSLILYPPLRLTMLSVGRLNFPFSPTCFATCQPFSSPRNSAKKKALPLPLPLASAPLRTPYEPNSVEFPDLSENFRADLESFSYTLDTLALPPQPNKRRKKKRKADLAPLPKLPVRVLSTEFMELSNPQSSNLNVASRSSANPTARLSSASETPPTTPNQPLPSITASDIGVAAAALSLENESNESCDNLPIIALVGRPNVGKSTIFNALVRGDTSLLFNKKLLDRMSLSRQLSRRSRKQISSITSDSRKKSIVTHIPGTTRDQHFGVAISMFGTRSMV